MITLDDIDFLIPIYADHSDRVRNLTITIDYLKRNGAKNVFVNEHYKHTQKVTFLNSQYICKDITDEHFYNKMLSGNELFKRFSKNKIVCLYDVDVLVTKSNLLEASEKLLTGYGFAYPYNGYFYDIPLNLVEQIQNNTIKEINLKDCNLLSQRSVGGCVMFNRDCFIEAGGFNPHIKNVGYDDDEINVRYTKLGYKKYRTNSPILHLTHFRGETTYDHNIYNGHNINELQKIDLMPIDQLQSYIKTW